MYSEGKTRAKVGKVRIDINGNRYRLRFTYPRGKRHELRIAHVSDDGWVLAIRAANLINRDIELEDFDESYARYSPSHAKALAIAKEVKPQFNLLQIWERYKDITKDRIAETSKRHIWCDCDRYLAAAPPSLLEMKNAQEFVAYLQGKYATTTIATLFRSCINPAVNMAVAKGLIETNSFDKVHIPKPQKKPIECFEPHEVKAIIAAFYSDEYNPPTSGYKHSYYATYVEVLALTGARPEEIIPLTIHDVKRRGGRTYLKFSKAYSKGVLLPHTKTKEIRLFPCNEQLTSVIASINPDNELLFPSVRGGYINHNTFRGHNWKTVLNGLVHDGKIEKYLKPYALRHSFITRLVRDGVDIKTVATLSGNSVQTIINHYLAAKSDFELPEL